MSTDAIGLAQLPRELASLTGQRPPGYRKLYSKVLDGELPAEQHNGRWFVCRSDLPTIAQLLGLDPPAGSGRRQQAAA